MKLSADRKTLTATLLNANGTETTNVQDVAKITGAWNGTTADYLNLQGVKIELQKTEYAKALLNYVDHALIGATDVLNAKVAFVPTSQSGNDAFKLNAAGQVEYAVKYTDENGNIKYCNLAITDYNFDVRFLRPLSLDKSKDTEIEDATSSTDNKQVIKLSELINGYKDFRDAWKIGTTRQIGVDDAGQPIYGEDNLDYETYYSPDGADDFNVAVQGTLNVGDFISANENVTTNLNQADPNTFVPLKDVSSIIDFKLTATDEITYVNNQATVQDFKVQIPVAIEYYWGTIYDKVTIHVKKTQSNAPRM